MNEISQFDNHYLSPVHENGIRNVPSVVEFTKISMESTRSPTEILKKFPSRPTLRRASIFTRDIRRKSSVIVINFWIAFRGIFCCVCSSVLYAINELLIKQLAGIHLAFIALIRFNGQGILSIAALPEISPDYIIGPRSARLLILLRSLSVGAALYLRYTAVRLLPLAEVRKTTPALISSDYRC